jgi:hypothetical protein
MTLSREHRCHGRRRRGSWPSSSPITSSIPWSASGRPPTACRARSSTGSGAAGVLAATLPHRPSTVARRLATWRTLHRVRDCGDPWANGRLGKLMAKARRGARRPSHAQVGRLLGPGPCSRGYSRLSTRRRCSACAIGRCSPQPSPPAAGVEARSWICSTPTSASWRRDPGGPSPQVQLRFARTKTQPDGHEVVIAGRPASFLLEWLAASSVETGAVFRSADSQGRLLDRGLSPAQFNRIVKARAKGRWRRAERGLRPRPPIRLHDPGFARSHPARGRYGAERASGCQGGDRLLPGPRSPG